MGQFGGSLHFRNPSVSLRSQKKRTSTTYSNIGKLTQILVSHPHLVPAVVEQQLEQLQTDRDAQNQNEEPSSESTNLVLYKFERPDFPLLFSGAAPLARRLPYAQCYGGHQFGMWAGQLGDGRAITLGELVNLKSQRWELQGTGKTPYSHNR